MYSNELLWNLRTNLPMALVLKSLEDILRLPIKRSEGLVRFLCPKCNEMMATINIKNNLAHCFCCSSNFNNIDLLRLNGHGFKESVEILCNEWNSFNKKGLGSADTEPRQYSNQPTKLGEIL